MPKIQLKLDKRMFNDNALTNLFDYSHRFEIYMGSAGSGKSYRIAQKLIIKGLNQKRKIMVFRKYGTTLKDTCMALFKNVLTQFKIIEYCDISDYNKRYVLPNGTEIIFSGLDLETKLLSLEGVTDIFCEELFEIEKDLWDQLDLRLRTRVPNIQLYGAFNPISPDSWLYEYCEVNPPDNLYYDKSTYKDNKFLPESYIKSLESMLKTNPRKARIYVLGMWGNDPEGLVYKNTVHVDDKHPLPYTIQSLLANRNIEIRIGLDRGWTDPTAIVLTLYDRPNNNIYIIDEFYARGKQLSELPPELERMQIKKQKIRCDSASPDVISYLNDKGFNAEGAKKGMGSVNAGIDFLQDATIYVYDDLAPNTAAELDNYSYVKDKKTNKYTDKTTHEWSHAMDALRYAYSDLYNLRKKVTLTGKDFYNI